ncbi:hypothetical protein B5E53_07850 [Eubacterium sp. An11]|uniref:O-antigen polysaccharide polymerase Wzy family protein n=1 Tax=Eubacterium sp. An11 TaxID=1965542 RepID=UPI000B379D6F|nr:O-antigen polysaccharide polymerase Wzy family protein [Eubacterium sp. An11]OUQ67899.1 hypothetical protein B5E53_07850 [Eubacterium sp. An11]
MKIKPQTIMIVIIDLIILLLTSLLQFNILFSMVMILCISVIYFSIIDLNNKSMLLAFVISFFTVLLAREMMEVFFQYQVESFPEKVNQHTYRVLLISLSIILLSYMFFYHRFKLDNKKNGQYEMSIFSKSVQNVSLFLFVISALCSIAYSLVVGSVLISIGYTGTYTIEFGNYLNGNFLYIIISKAEQTTAIFLSFFYASMPSKRKCRIATWLYMIYLCTTLLSGQRSTVVLGFLWIFIYYAYRNKNDTEQSWISKRMLCLIALLVPFAIVFLSLVSAWREGIKISIDGLWNEIQDFFYQQGVSINVIKRSFQYEALLPEGKYYSLEFLSTGVIGKILGAEPFVGNSVEHATNGFSLAHALSYVTMRGAYLTGRGTGTSYIAELFHDFGYLGVVFGNILYGYIIASMSKLKGKNLFMTAIKLIIIQQILWSPRGGFSDFIIILNRPATLIAICLIYIIASILNRRKVTKASVNTVRSWR